jgi:hypothetical protein
VAARDLAPAPFDSFADDVEPVVAAACREGLREGHCHPAYATANIQHRTVGFQTSQVSQQIDEVLADDDRMPPTDELQPGWRYIPWPGVARDAFNDADGSVEHPSAKRHSPAGERGSVHDTGDPPADLAPGHHVPNLLTNQSTARCPCRRLDTARHPLGAHCRCPRGVGV